MRKFIIHFGKSWHEGLGEFGINESLEEITSMDQEKFKELERKFGRLVYIQIYNALFKREPITLEEIKDEWSKDGRYFFAHTTQTFQHYNIMLRPHFWTSDGKRIPALEARAEYPYIDWDAGRFIPFFKELGYGVGVSVEQYEGYHERNKRRMSDDDFGSIVSHMGLCGD